MPTKYIFPPPVAERSKLWLMRDSSFDLCDSKLKEGSSFMAFLTLYAELQLRKKYCFEKKIDNKKLDNNILCRAQIATTIAM